MGFTESWVLAHRSASLTDLAPLAGRGAELVARHDDGWPHAAVIGHPQNTRLGRRAGRHHHRPPC